MSDRREQVKWELKRLLLLIERGNLFTSEQLRQGLDKQTPRAGTFHAIQAMGEIQAEILKLFGPVAGKQLLDEQISAICGLIDRNNVLRQEASVNTKLLPTTPIAVVCQEPVGHGGFHTGTLGLNEPLFRWVYDCGSWTKRSALQRQVDDFVRRCGQTNDRETDVDLLFISHFHADHISGIATLIGEPANIRLRVHTAVIPYISPETGFEILANAVAEERCTDDLIDLVTRPAKYCADRAIKRLVIVRPRQTGTDTPEPELGPSTPQLNGAPPPGDAGRVLSLIFLQPDGTVLQTKRDPETGVEVAEAMPGTVGAISAVNVWADWWFVPHASEWASRREQLLEAAQGCIKVHPSEPGFNEALVTKLRTPAGLQGLRAVYKPMNSNGTSLSLFAGPPHNLLGRVSWSSDEKKPVGWLLTGDTPLKPKTQMNPFTKSFDVVKNEVGHLMLPHHGAEENFNESLQRFAESARLFVTVNELDFQENKRPPEAVRSQLLKRNELEHVSEEPTTILRDISGPIGEERRKETLNW